MINLINDYTTIAYTFGETPTTLGKRIPQIVDLSVKGLVPTDPIVRDHLDDIIIDSPYLIRIGMLYTVVNLCIYKENSLSARKILLEYLDDLSPIVQFAENDQCIYNAISGILSNIFDTLYDFSNIEHLDPENIEAENWSSKYYYLSTMYSMFAIYSKLFGGASFLKIMDPLMDYNLSHQDKYEMNVKDFDDTFSYMVQWMSTAMLVCVRGVLEKNDNIDSCKFADNGFPTYMEYQNEDDDITEYRYDPNKGLTEFETALHRLGIHRFEDFRKVIAATIGKYR